MMQKTYFHNYKIDNKNKKKLSEVSSIDIKKVVDVNILLNKVKIEKKNQTKQQIIFCSFITLAIGLIGTLIIIIK